MKKTGLALAAALLAMTTLGAHAAPAGKSMTYTAKLTGMAEKPVGAMHGSGTARITLNMAARTVCYNITVMGIKLPAAAAHIHAGKAGTNGNVVVPFPTVPNKNGHAANCVHAVKASLIASIEKNPAAYYVNIHTTDHPDGAVRGQL